VRMTDLVSGMNITTFPIIGLVIFGIIFAVIALRALTLPAHRARHAAALPLDDSPTSPDTDANAPKTEQVHG
jgi:hypothetical protein